MKIELREKPQWGLWIAISSVTWCAIIVFMQTFLLWADKSVGFGVPIIVAIIVFGIISLLTIFNVEMRIMCNGCGKLMYMGSLMCLAAMESKKNIEDGDKIPMTICKPCFGKIKKLNFNPMIKR